MQTQVDSQNNRFQVKTKQRVTTMTWEQIPLVWCFGVLLHSRMWVAIICERQGQCVKVWDCSLLLQSSDLQSENVLLLCCNISGASRKNWIFLFIPLVTHLLYITVLLHPHVAFYVKLSSVILQPGLTVKPSTYDQLCQLMVHSTTFSFIFSFQTQSF